MCRAETMRRKWKDPEFREKVLIAQKVSLDERIKRKLLRDLANGGDSE